MYLGGEVRWRRCGNGRSESESGLGNGSLCLHRLSRWLTMQGWKSENSRRNGEKGEWSWRKDVLWEGRASAGGVVRWSEWG